MTALAFIAGLWIGAAAGIVIIAIVTGGRR